MIFDVNNEINFQAMKPVLIFSILSFLLTSCSSDNDSNKIRDLENLPQTWELISFTTGLINQTTTGDEMPFQEKYILNKDKTFKKTRDQNGSIMQAEGTFFYEVEADFTYLVLTYVEENNIIVNCTKETKETLRYDKELDVLETTSQLCDAGTLVYRIL